MRLSKGRKIGRSASTGRFIPVKVAEARATVETLPIEEEEVIFPGL
jgi:hypothetical protein